MTTNLATILIRAIEAADLDAAPYSGRGMYGKKCVSFESDEGSEYALMLIGAALAGAGADVYAFRRVAVDSMGLGSVIYWPRIEWPADESDDDGDDESDLDSAAEVRP